MLISYDSFLLQNIGIRKNISCCLDDHGSPQHSYQYDCSCVEQWNGLPLFSSWFEFSNTGCLQPKLENPIWSAWPAMKLAITDVTDKKKTKGQRHELLFRGQSKN